MKSLKVIELDITFFPKITTDVVCTLNQSVLLLILRKFSELSGYESLAKLKSGNIWRYDILHPLLVHYPQSSTHFLNFILKITYSRLIRHDKLFSIRVTDLLSRKFICYLKWRKTSILLKLAVTYNKLLYIM